MNIELRYFGIIAELTGKQQENLSAEVNTVQELRSWVESKYAEIAGQHYVVAVNQVLVKEEDTIAEHAEVALLPPFAGG